MPNPNSYRDILSQKNPAAPMTALDERDYTNSPHASLKKSALAAQIAQAEIRIRTIEQRNHEYQQQTAQKRADIIETRNKVSKTPELQKVYQSFLPEERLAALEKQLNDLTRRMQNNWSDLIAKKEELNALKAEKPSLIEFYERLKQQKVKQAETAKEEAETFSNAFNELADELKLGDEFKAQKQELMRNFEKTQRDAATLLEREARYRASLKKAGKKDLRKEGDTLHPKAKQQVAIGHVLMQEFKMRNLLALLLQEAMGYSYPKANMTAGRFVRKVMTDDMINSRISRTLADFDENSVNSATDTLLQLSEEESLAQQLNRVEVIIIDLSKFEEQATRHANELDQLSRELDGLKAQINYANPNELKSPFGMQPTPRMRPKGDPEREP